MGGYGMHVLGSKVSDAIKASGQFTDGFRRIAFASGGYMGDGSPERAAAMIWGFPASVLAK
jgi:hypothetical protein